MLLIISHVTHRSSHVSQYVCLMEICLLIDYKVDFSVLAFTLFFSWLPSSQYLVEFAEVHTFPFYFSHKTKHSNLSSTSCFAFNQPVVAVLIYNKQHRTNSLALFIFSPLSFSSALPLTYCYVLHWSLCDLDSSPGLCNCLLMCQHYSCRIPWVPMCMWW